MCFFKKIQEWILKSERILKRILRFFTEQINPRSVGSRSLKEPKNPLHDPRDLVLICSVKKRKIRFRILSDLRIQSWIFLKKRTLCLTRLPTEKSREPFLDYFLEETALSFLLLLFEPVQCLGKTFLSLVFCSVT